MTLSVALCTYNGEKYIEEQIRSILEQTMPVDEVVVCDDGSTDDTLQYIERIGATTTVPIRVYRNHSNLGPSRNFQKAISLCEGDVVFLSDQDDVWNENKVRTMVEWLNENPSKSVVFSDADLIDDEGNPVTDRSLWDCIGFSAQAQKALDDGFGAELFCYENRATGATMAVRRDYAVNSCFVEVCNDTILHDGALAMLALGDGSLGYIPEKLIRYRCHSEQSVGIGAAAEKPLSENPRETSPLVDVWAHQKLPETLRPRIDFLALRRRMMGQRMGFFRMLKNRCRYKMFYHDQWKSFLGFDIAQWKKHVFHQ